MASRSRRGCVATEARLPRTTLPPTGSSSTPRASTPTGLARSFYTSSSCGVCGKAAIKAVVDRGRAVRLAAARRGLLAGLPDALRAAQAAFAVTGGLHAAGLFAADGTLRCLREDVGRHNALDKVVGELLAAASALQHVLSSGGLVRARPEGGGRRHPGALRRRRALVACGRARRRPRRHALRLRAQRARERLQRAVARRPLTGALLGSSASRRFRLAGRRSFEVDRRAACRPRRLRTSGSTRRGARRRQAGRAAVRCPARCRRGARSDCRRHVAGLRAAAHDVVGLPAGGLPVDDRPKRCARWGTRAATPRCHKPARCPVRGRRPRLQELERRLASIAVCPLPRVRRAGRSRRAARPACRRRHRHALRTCPNPCSLSSCS